MESTACGRGLSINLPSHLTGIEGDEWGRMCCKYVEVGRAVSIRYPGTSRKARDLVQNEKQRNLERNTMIRVVGDQLKSCGNAASYGEDTNKEECQLSKSPKSKQKQEANGPSLLLPVREQLERPFLPR